MISLPSLLESASVTLILTRGSILRPLREHGPALWQELTSCALCAGVWIGAAWSVAEGPSSGSYLRSALDAVGAGATTGVLALAVSLGLDALERFEEPR